MTNAVFNTDSKYAFLSFLDFFLLSILFCFVRKTTTKNSNKPRMHRFFHLVKLGWVDFDANYMINAVVNADSKYAFLFSFFFRFFVFFVFFVYFFTNKNKIDKKNKKKI